MHDLEILELLFGLLGIGIVAIIAKVWKIPSIEQKLDSVIKETENNRGKIHRINNTLQHHEYRIDSLEKSREELKAKRS